jgi:hypothetical protein
VNFRQKIAVGVADVAVLAELTLSIYFASFQPQAFTSHVFLYFFSMLIPTLALAIAGVRHLATPVRSEP